MVNLVTTNIEKLLDTISESEIIVVEGFEFVGKSHIISLITDELENVHGKSVLNYRPDYESLGYDDILDRSNRYILGLPAIEMYKSVRDTLNASPVLILDRSVFSSYVYSILYNSVPVDRMIQVMSTYRKIFKDFKVSVIQVTPYTEDSSKLLYTQALSDDDHKDKYDKFESFTEYFQVLNKVEYLFNESYITYQDMFSDDDIKFIKYYNKIEE